MIEYIQKYRYRIILFLIVVIILLGLFLNIQLGMTPDKVAPILVSSFVIIALFLNALSFEYTWHKNLKDSQAARESVTFNTALEWHKSPLKDYIIRIVIAEAKDISRFITEKDGKGLHDFISKPENIETRAALAGIFNYFETIAIGVKQKLIDAEFIKVFFKASFITFWKEYEFYIRYRREEIDKTDSVWENFTLLAQNWDTK
jgi:hypothetical protein